MEPLGPCLHLMGDPMILIMILVTVFEDLEVQVLHCQVCKKYPVAVCSEVPHCSKLEIVLNENDTPQNQQFLLVYTLVLPKESRLQKSVDIQG